VAGEFSLQPLGKVLIRQDNLAVRAAPEFAASPSVADLC
jgi:hypothetical protein